jgi:hypothetical protein
MNEASSAYRAGAASVCITPTEPLWLAGYAVRTAPARGTLSDLFANALVVEDEAGTRFVLVSADLIAITPIIANAVFAAALARHGLDRSHVMLVPTHTHYGPEFRPDKAVFFNIPPEYAAKLPDVASNLAAAINQAIDKAIANLTPARLYISTTSVGFAHNRRRHGVKDGTPSTEDTVDHEVPILVCVDASGQRKAIVFGYACHNTTLPPEDLRYSADWAGYAKQQLEQHNPGATALFVPGAGADQDPEPRGSIEIAREHGINLANAVQRTLDSDRIEVSGPIRVELDDIELELSPITPELLQQMLASADPPQREKARFLIEQQQRGEEWITSYRAPIQVVRLGQELTIIGLSGEPVVDWSLKLKQRARTIEFGANAMQQDEPVNKLPPPMIWVAGYCNDMFGYVPTHRVQQEGGYEAGRASLWSWIPAPFTTGIERQIDEAVNRLIHRTVLPRRESEGDTELRLP